MAMTNSYSVSSNSGMQPTSLAMSLMQDRRMPCLARGWRTPDPSPTRGLGDLPSCKPGSWWAVDHHAEEDPALDDDTETVVDDRSEAGGCDGVEQRGRSLARRCDVYGEVSSDAGESATRHFFVPSRTPSPVPCLSVAQKENYDLAMSFMRSKIGLSHSFSTICPESEGTSDFTPRRSIQYIDTSRTPTPPSAEVSTPASSTVMNATWSGNFDADLAAGVPPPPPPAPAMRELLGLPEGCPSVGSLNHPHGCADFCKYAKKTRGCKDGEACSRCHICTTKKFTNQGFRPRPGYGRNYNKFQQRRHY